MLKSGMLTGSNLKAAVRIKRVESDSEDESEEDQDEEKKGDYITPGNPDDDVQ